MKKQIIIIIALLNFYGWQVKAQNYEIISPDRKITILVEVGKSLSYAVKYKNKFLIRPSRISLFLQPDLIIGKESVVSDTLTRFVNNKIIPVVKEKRAIIPDVFNELILRFVNHFELHFRVYNDGVAYRFASSLPGEITVIDEEANFNFQPGTIVFYSQVSKRPDADIFHTSFEEPYSKAKLDSLPEDMFAFSPVLLQPEGLPKVLITESDIEDYPGMFLVKGNGSGLKGKFAPYPLKEIVSGGEFKQKLVVERAPFIAKTKGLRTFPWRIIAIAPTDADLLINDLVYRLAPDPDFSDFSWIKPGKSTEEWITGLNLYGVDFEAGLNTETYKYYIDFAALFGFEYVMLDAGWSDVNDLFRITPGMDMEEITAYAKQKGIGLILWTQALTIEKQMEPAFQQFKKWDIKIVMTDFIDRDDQLAINFMRRFAGECARYKFMCMIHGAPKPAGFSRTYPNMLAREGILGSEYNVWSSKANPEHDLMIPFIRMFSGPMDYEPGILQNATRGQTVKMGFEKVIAQGTRMHQIAMFVVYESPLQLFSGNLSDAVREPELMKFLGTIPTEWDETIILDAQFGKYIVEARRNGDNWYLAAINDWQPCNFTVPLSFLKEGGYLVEIASDGKNATRNPHDYKLKKSEITATDTLTVKLAPGGGFVACILKN
ncbi:MAG: glycoside hydrolase family 97 protein [Bacteroidia bacterium]|nr:glycoside hydrolase family 97 protein [Bacteroidia bacterium]